MTLLKERDVQVSYYDTYVPVIKLTRERPQWAGVKSIAWEAKTIKTFDLVLIATKHATVDYSALAQWADCIVDTRNAMAGLPTREGQVRKA
jgi:UDP-N-acetyl-D-glucosamine dehydrogenase